MNKKEEYLNELAERLSLEIYDCYNFLIDIYSFVRNY